MRLGQLSSAQLAQRAANPGLGFRAGPFRILLRSRLGGMLEVFQRLYAHAPVEPAEGIFDFHIQMVRGGGMRRWLRPQALFRLDGSAPFEPYPLSHAFPLMEWGLNYSIAMRAHRYCMLHSAVVAREDRALILPAMPGSGKSTLCAALIHRGWRLLSDEFGMVRPESGLMQPLPRVVPLKNESIEVMRHFAPQALLGPVFPKTRKGDVAHLAPPETSLLAQDRLAEPRWIVFPRFGREHRPALDPIPKSQAFIRLANNAFNYQLLGETGFRTLAQLIEQCACYRFEYDSLDHAVELIEANCR